MSNNSREAKDIGRFIRARREASDVSSYADIPQRRRHVSHLTQADLADLIGISTVVISQIEQGRYKNLNAAILQKIAHSLRFTHQQEIFMFGLLDERPATQQTPKPAPDWLTATIKGIAHPVMLVNPAYDVIESNTKARTLLSGLSPHFTPQFNGAASVFQSKTAKEFIPDWLAYARSVVSGIKMNYAMFPSWRAYIDSLTDRLAAEDEVFHELWNQDDPLVKPTIEKELSHPELGELNVMQVLIDIIEAPSLTRIDFKPADETTRQKFARL